MKKYPHSYLGLDTNIFIYHYQDSKEFVSQTDVLFAALEKKKSRAVTSIITLIELLSFNIPEKEVEKIQDAFQSTPQLTVLPVNDDISLVAARIRRKYRYSLPDAIQLATAIHAKADVFITNDKRLQKFKELKIVLLGK